MTHLIFNDPNNIYNIFKAMEGDESDNDYLANVALAAAEELKFMRYDEENKNSNESEHHREEGNKFYKSGLLQKALISYNKALAYAPNGSLALKLAYANRSALLFSVKEYEACGVDCKLALAINCTTAANIIEKLRKRMLNAKVQEKKSNLVYCENIKLRKFSEDYFKLKSKNNEIPCASADVEINFESQFPKVVAKNDIPSGTLVAVEKAFVSWSDRDPDQYISCYYCRKLCLNLVPCSGCVAAMFCSKQCEESCMIEYHNVECHAVGKFTKTYTKYKWVIKVLIKLRNMCSSWDEFVLMSIDYGYNRIRKSTAKEIFDVDNPSSVLTFRDDRHFLYGALFNTGVINGMFLNILGNVDSFMPEDWAEKLLAMKAMARVLMYLALYCSTSILILSTNILDRNGLGFYPHDHRGVFPFVGKLKNSCVSNLQMLAGNNEIALIAIEPIKAGTELTVSHIYHWLENKAPKNLRRRLLLDRHEICTCFVCNATPEEWARIKEETTNKASPAMKKSVVDCFTLDQHRMLGIPLDKCFEKIFKAFTLLKDIPFSSLYEKVFNQLIDFILLTTHTKCQNVILSQDF